MPFTRLALRMGSLATAGCAVGSVAWGHSQLPDASAALPPFAPGGAHAGFYGVAAVLIALMAMRRTPSRRLVAAAVVLLWVAAAPIVSLHLTHHELERGAPTCTVLEIAQATGPASLASGWSLALPGAAGWVTHHAPPPPAPGPLPVPNARSPPFGLPRV